MKIKYLVIRFSSIGDIVLTSPVIRCLKQQVEGAEVHFVTKKRHASIVASNPYIDKVHVLKESLPELINELEKEQFDYIIDLHQNIRSNRIKSKLKMPSFSFQKLNFKKYLLVKFKINRMPGKHIVDRYMETLSVFDVKNDGKGLDFFIPDNESYPLSELPEAFQNGYIAFVIAGTYSTKRLPAEKIIEICNGIDHPVILLGGKNESGEAQKIVDKTGKNVISLSGKISLNQSASLVRDAALVLSNDTGLMHIAAAFKKKVLSFWGNTVPEFGMVPYQADPASEIMEVKNLKCRPCSKLGYRKCPKKHFRCMRDLDSRKSVNWINRHFPK
ncbi:MAG: glycosyltransferase family 9 protein [Tangfeifania sp.]